MNEFTAAIAIESISATSIHTDGSSRREKQFHFQYHADKFERESFPIKLPDDEWNIK